MFHKNVNSFNFSIFLLLLLLLLLTTRKSFGLVNPLYTEYYANYHNHPEDDDKLNYKFHYFIDHAPTKVHIMHLEERQGDRVRGQYGLLEPNGMVRMVHYQVVGDGGFQSIVQTRTPHSTTHIRLRNRSQPKLPLILNSPVAAVI